MPRKRSARTVVFIPDISKKQKIHAESKACRSYEQGRRISSSPSMRLFRYLRGNIARAISLISGRRRHPTHEPEGSAAEAAPQRFVPPRDSHHSECLEDCIEFINASYRKSL